MRYAAYCRVSTGSDEQLSSLVNQRKFFEEYTQKRGESLVKVYADRGISGKSMERRTEFLHLLEDSKNGEFDAVLVKDISRFARNTLDFLTGIRVLKSNGIDVIFIGANQKVLGESEFVLTLFAALAQEESCALSKRIVFGKKQGAKRGRVPNLIYGYNKVDTYRLEINEKEAKTVREIFNWYAYEGMGLRKIAAALNADGIKTKLGNKWEPKTIRRMLANPIYKGVLITNKSETEDFILAKRRLIPEEERYYHRRGELVIVDDVTFDKVQDMFLKGNSTLSF